MTDHPFGRRQVDQMSAYNTNDEINLVDVVRVLFNKKKTILIITVLCTLLAITYAVSKPAAYEYSINIDIGSTDVSTPDGPVTKLIEGPENVMAKLTDAYIPKVLTEYRIAHPEDQTAYDIEVSNPKGSSIILLKAKGSEDSARVYNNLIKQVVEMLVIDHDKKIKIARSEVQKRYNLASIKLNELEDKKTLAVQDLVLESKLIETQTQLDALEDPRLMVIPRREIEKNLKMEQQILASLKDQEAIIRAQGKRLDQSRELMAKQIADLEAQVTSALIRRQTAETTLDNESKAMTMLMIDNEIQQNRDRLGKLEERLYIDLENQREKLSAELNDNILSQDVQQQEIMTVEKKLDNFLIANANEIKALKPKVSLLTAQIAKQDEDQIRAIQRKREDIKVIEDRLNNIQPTQAVSDVLTSWKSVGPGKSIIATLGLIIGLMLGVFVVFIREFIRNIDAVNPANVKTALVASDEVVQAIERDQASANIKTFSKSSV